jgi:hypothetical protein
MLEVGRTICHHLRNCAKTLTQTLATKEVAVASWQDTIFQQGIFDQRQHDCHHPPTLLFWLGSLWFFSISMIEDTAILTQLRLSGQNCRRCWTRLQNMTSRIHLEMTSTGKGARIWEVATPRVLVAGRPKFSSRSDGNTSPWNCG